MHALAVLTRQPHPTLVAFYQRLAQEGYEVFVFVDDNTVACARKDGVRFIQVDDGLCAGQGYQGFNPVITKPGAPLVSAWDKALFYFGQVNRGHRQVWFVEDDVFVPRAGVFGEIDRAFQTADLLSEGNVVNTTGELESWAWWPMVPHSRLALPWAKSMVCAVRVSRRLLRIVAEYVTRHPTAPKFIEYVFHTLALHHGLSVEVVKHLQGIAWRRDWTAAELNRDTLYHPVKSIAQQAECWAYLAGVESGSRQHDGGPSRDGSR